MDRRIFIAHTAFASWSVSHAQSANLSRSHKTTAATSQGRPLWALGAVELASKIREGQVSAHEATASCLERMRAVNPSVNAVVEGLETQALASADAADRLRAAGAPLPPLHGVPVTVKINVDMAGLPTTDGVVAFKQAIANEDHSSVANLKRGGAIIIGRTNTPSFSFRWFTDNDLHGRTLNPWDPAVTPGGSSGGAAAAVAVGIGPIAHGNDIAGSVRYPAYCCGVAGIRPTVGLVPSFNPSSAKMPAGISAQLMGVQGLLARRIEDLRMSLPVLSRRDPRDPTFAGSQSQLEALPANARIAVLRALPGVRADQSVLAGLDLAVATLRSAGYTVEEVVPPSFQEAADLWSPFVLNEIGPGLNGAAQKFGDEHIRTALKTWLDLTRNVELAGFSQILARRFQIRREWSQFLQRYPILITPVSWRQPFPIDFDQQGPEAFEAILKAQSPSLVIALMGLPGLTVPTGVFEGLPTAVQVVSEWFREDLCFDVGALIEASTAVRTPIDPRGARKV